MPSQVTISGSKSAISGGASSETIGPYLVNNSNNIPGITNLILTGATFMGFTLVATPPSATNATIPANAKGVVIVPQVAPVGTLKLKGVTGDTGTFISQVDPFVLVFDAGNAPAFGLLASVTMNVDLHWF